MARPHIVYVVDASVILKWFIEEEDSEKAIAIKNSHAHGEYSLVIPDLAIYEISNALRYKPNFSPGEIKECCQNLYDLDLIIIAPIPDTVDLATDIAYKYNITFYDAFYISLAQEVKASFITADVKLYNKVKKSLHFVRNLKEI